MTGFDASVPVLRLQAVRAGDELPDGHLDVRAGVAAAVPAAAAGQRAAAVVAIVATLLLAPPLGAEGAAIATVLRRGGAGGGALWRRCGGARPALVPISAVVPKVVVASAPGVAVALCVAGSGRWCSRSLAGAAYAVVAFALRAVPPEAIAALRPAAR